MEDSAELESQLVESINSVKTIKQFGIEDFANVKTEIKFIAFIENSLSFRSQFHSLRHIFWISQPRFYHYSTVGRGWFCGSIGSLLPANYLAFTQLLAISPHQQQV